MKIYNIFDEQWHELLCTCYCRRVAELIKKALEKTYSGASFRIEITEYNVYKNLSKHPGYKG